MWKSEAVWHSFVHHHLKSDWILVMILSASLRIFPLKLFLGKLCHSKSLKFRVRHTLDSLLKGVNLKMMWNSQKIYFYYRLNFIKKFNSLKNFKWRHSHHESPPPHILCTSRKFQNIFTITSLLNFAAFIFFHLV
jgi:hypothetical protein